MGAAVAGAGRRPDVLAGNSCYVPAPVAWIGSTYLAGFSDVRKLGGAALLGPGPKSRPQAALLDLRSSEYLNDVCTGAIYEYVGGALNYQGRPRFPPARATFLTFGFTPVRARLELTQLPITCRDITGRLVAQTRECITAVSNPNNTYTVSATSKMLIRIYDVSVNGVPLDAGVHCQTVVPMSVTLTASSHAQYDVTKGGILAGYARIPHFTRCGVNENLDPIFDASISGPANYIKMTQGPTCAKFLAPPLPPNHNCLIPPGPGHPNGIPKYMPTPQH